MTARHACFNRIVFILRMHDIHASDVDLNLLVALDALLSERSVSRAAARLGLTQSAMSHRLRRLRERFGDELLVGGRSGMVPTPRAQEIAAPIRRGLLELGEVLRQPEVFDPLTSRRRFTIVSSDYAEMVVMPHVLERFGREAPFVDMELRTPDLDVVGRLARGEADLYVGPTLDSPHLVRLHVRNERSVCVVRADHPRVKTQLDMRTFLELGHVVVGPEDGTAHAIDVELGKRGMRRRIVLQISRFGGAPFVVARSDVLAVLPLGVAHAAAAYLPLRILPAPMPFPEVAIDVMWHERMNDDAGHRWS